MTWSVPKSEVWANKQHAGRQVRIRPPEGIQRRPFLHEKAQFATDYSSAAPLHLLHGFLRFFPSLTNSPLEKTNRPIKHADKTNGPTKPAEKTNGPIKHVVLLLDAYWSLSLKVSRSFRRSARKTHEDDKSTLNYSSFVPLQSYRGVHLGQQQTRTAAPSIEL